MVDKEVTKEYLSRSWTEQYQYMQKSVYEQIS